MSISAAFIRRPIGTSLLAAALLLAGIAAWPFLPVAPLPQVDFPTIQVMTSFPGASPETMAATVATPLERQFSLIPGLNQMTSTSYVGSTVITLQFELDRQIDAAATDVLAAINAAGGALPKELPNPPTFRKTNPADRPIMLLAVTSESLPLTEVSDHADNILAQQISQIRGVGQVDIGGQQKPAVRIRAGTRARGHPGAGRGGDRQCAEGNVRRTETERHRLRQRSDSFGQGVERRRRRVSQRRADTST